MIPDEQLLQADVLAERRLNQPLSAVTLLQRRSGIVGLSTATATDPAHEATPASAPRPPLQEVLQHGGQEFLQLALLLVAGCMLAALVQTLLPRPWLLNLGSSPTGSIVALMALSLVISVCSSVDAFLALSFAAQVTPGALLAFLLLGPVIDLKLAGLLSLLLRPKGLLLAMAGAALGVLLIAQWINLWLL
jgi:uncharacterized membrane protein YraQ (UPF0718 family)